MKCVCRLYNHLSTTMTINLPKTFPPPQMTKEKDGLRETGRGLYSTFPLTSTTAQDREIKIILQIKIMLKMNKNDGK